MIGSVSVDLSVRDLKLHSNAEKSSETVNKSTIVEHQKIDLSDLCVNQHKPGLTISSEKQTTIFHFCELVAIIH